VAQGQLREFLDTAVTLALEAGQFVRARYQQGIAVELKADHSPVTDADRGAERLLRDRLAERYPEHAIAGEEFGASQARRSHRWYIDPIDGTRSFVHGVPLFGILIGLEIEGEMTVGVCHLPALGDTVAAARGLGCTWNGRPARVSGTRGLGEATVVYSDCRQLERRVGARWSALQDATLLQRGWGDCYGHCLVATGRADVMLDPVMNPWDIAALVPILQESGGRLTDWTGATRVDGGDAMSSNGHLHDAVLSALRGAPPGTGLR
jgi:histidinol phosphatase-like enzyme (inositol monophosphatase family)